MPNNIFNLKIFEGIDNETVNEIIENCNHKTFSKGEKVVKQEDKSNGEGYIIKSGEVSISISGEEIAKLGTGEMFGEIALLNEEPRTATVEALTQLDVIVLKLEDLINMINNDENKINKEVIRRLEENLENERKV